MLKQKSENIYFNYKHMMHIIMSMKYNTEA